MIAIPFQASPNHGERAPGKPVDILLLHYTGMPSAEGALKWLCDPASQVSSHYFVFEDGRVVQMVDEGRRAQHAGVSLWAGEADINSRSIGIEVANPGHAHGYPVFPDAQIVALIGLCQEILARHPIPATRVLAHSDVAPTRKEDPGERFPWARLHAAGIGHWVVPAPLAEGPTYGPGDSGAAVAFLQARLRQYGYGIDPTGQFDELTAAVVRAFQRHFRPERVDGLADGSTVATLERLLTPAVA